MIEHVGLDFLLQMKAGRIDAVLLDKSPPNTTQVYALRASWNFYSLLLQHDDTQRKEERDISACKQCCMMDSQIVPPLILVFLSALLTRKSFSKNNVSIYK